MKRADFERLVKEAWDFHFRLVKQFQEVDKKQWSNKLWSPEFEEWREVKTWLINNKNYSYDTACDLQTVMKYYDAWHFWDD